MIDSVKKRLTWPLVGYIVLAVFVAYAIGAVRDQGSNGRNDLAGAAKAVIVDSCQRDNNTRAVLRNLMTQNIPQTKKFVAEGTLTQAQADRTIKATEDAVRNLPNTNCKAAGERFIKNAHIGD